MSSILGQSFVVIESLAFFENKNLICIAQESSQYLGMKNKTIHKQDWFFAFCVYKNVLQNNSFLYINENYNDYHQWNTTCTFYIYKRQKKCKLFFIQKYRHIAKARQLASRFIYKKPDTLRYVICHETSEVGIYVPKVWNFALRDVFIKAERKLRKK